MRTYKLNIDKVRKFMERKEKEQMGKVREVVYTKDKCEPRLAHKYEERGKKAVMPFELKTGYKSLSQERHWSFKG